MTFEDNHPGLKECINWKDALIAFSLSNLFFLRAWHELIFAEPGRLFYLKTPTAFSIMALLLNVFVVGGLVWGVFILLKYTRNKYLRFFVALLIFVSLIFPLNSLRILVTSLSITELVGFLGPITLGALLVALAGVIILAASFKPAKVINIISIIYLIFAPFLLVTIGQALFHLGTYEASPSSQVEQVSPGEDQPSQRVVWFIFDELDQRMTFEERPEEIDLPEIDSLKQESLYATNAHAPGEETVLSMPSFVTGKKIKQAEPKGPEKLELTSANEESFKWSEKKNIFEKAGKLGGQSGLCGVFLPYCRVIGDTLDTCSWQPFGTVEHKGDRSLPGTMLDQLTASISFSPFNQRYHAKKVHESLYEDAKTLVTDPHLDLVLVHWSIPHYPWIYDRTDMDFSLLNYDMKKGYYDNLALVDKTIKSMRKAMQEADTWEKTHLIVSSDHPWRMELFPTYDEKYDSRIPFLVRTADNQNKVVHEDTFNTVITHDLVLELLKENISTPEEISNWLKSR